MDITSMMNQKNQRMIHKMRNMTAEEVAAMSSGTANIYDPDDRSNDYVRVNTGFVGGKTAFDPLPMPDKTLLQQVTAPLHRITKRFYDRGWFAPLDNLNQS